jgi:hypothetical protein
MGLVGHVEHMEAIRNAYKTLFGKPEGERPLEGPGRRLEDNIKMDLKSFVFGLD